MYVFYIEKNNNWMLNLYYNFFLNIKVYANKNNRFSIPQYE